MLPSVYLKSRITRAWSGAVLALLIAVLAWFACLYFGFIGAKEAEIDTAYDLSPEVVVSNIRGNQSDDLELPDWMVLSFLPGGAGAEDYAPYVRDLRLKGTLYYSVYPDEAAARENQGVYSPEQKLVGVNVLEAAPALTAIEGVTVTYLREDAQALWSGEEAVCLIPESLLGSTVEDEEGVLRLYLGVQPSTAANRFELTAPEVVGYYTGGPSIYCSWGWLNSLQLALEDEITADSLRFTVADSRKLDELRRMLSRLFTEVDPSGKSLYSEAPFSPVGFYQYAVTIHDEELRQTLSDLNRNLSTLRRLMPLILVLEFILSAATSFFFVQLRKRELAVARSLGTPRSGILLTLLVEMLIWCAAAALLTAVASVLTPISILKPAAVCAVMIAALVGALISGYHVTGQMGLRSLKEDN